MMSLKRAPSDKAGQGGEGGQEEFMIEECK